MPDPNEGLTAEGYIQTGVRRELVAPVFEPVIEAALTQIEQLDQHVRLASAALYIYGSVASGSAVVPTSDVDLLTIGILPEAADRISRELSSDFSSICRGTEIATASLEDFEGDRDEAYGGRIFIRHYCLHLWGRALPGGAPYRGDMRAARAFNGDIASCYQRWCALENKESPEQLGRAVARKSLLAVAGLISISDQIWTTDRLNSARRWMQLNPDWSAECEKLIAWSDGSMSASKSELAKMLSPGGLIGAIVDDFRSSIGLWQS